MHKKLKILQQHCLHLFFSITGAAIGSYSGIPNGALIGALAASAFIFIKIGGSSPPLANQFVQISLGIGVAQQVGQLGGIPLSEIIINLCFLLFILTIQFSIGFLWLVKKNGWSRQDALLAVYPGALGAIFDLIDTYKSSNKVVVVHLVRHFAIVCLAAILIFMMPAPATSTLRNQASIFQTDLSTLVLLLSASVIVLIIGNFLQKRKWPAPYLLVSMLVFSSLSLGGDSLKTELPKELVFLATCLLAILISERLSTLSIEQLTDAIKSGAGAIILMFTACIIFALMISRFGKNTLLETGMAYAPGGIETVLIVGLAYGADTVYLTYHHLFRMILVQLAPAALILWKKEKKIID